MALGTYAELQASIANWMERSGDSTIAAVLPDVISLVTAKLNRELRTGEMEATVTLTGTGGVFSLPDDFVAWRAVSDASFGPLELVTPDWAAENYPTGLGGTPRYFTIEGATLTTYPATSSTIRLAYYKAIPDLSEAAPTNWVLAAHPDAYLFNGLAEINAFIKDADAAMLWGQRGDAAINAINRQDINKRYSNVSVRVKGPTP